MNDLFLDKLVSDFVLYIPKIPTVLTVVLGGGLVIKVFNKSVRKMLEIAKVDRTLIQFVTTFIAFACWVFLISLVFSVLGFTQISLAFSGSIALVIMGVASNAGNLVQDLLAGIFLIAEPDFKVGQQVRLNTITGKIVGLDIKKTKVIDDQGNIHVIPNKMFDANVFVIEQNQATKLEKGA